MSGLVKRHFSGALLREARKNAGFTQEALARRVDVTLRTVTRWESEGQPKGSELLSLAEILGVSPDAFYESEEIPA